ncbi:c-type cytochrome [Oculatella sp. LEGE 06141]|uniref:c-type cytochrome n=1 Tax=Oculatella sp. LEGE 06141 TaxID=1828648 RepID=UPI00187EC7CB|nr:c-type cytochrome [Oculatella sp. LEGE 06141]MBE9180774.1 c-type cytochrome [Oculatella sp. LEGE 06141]
MLSVLLLGLILAPSALAVDMESGEQIFGVYCIGCHGGGGNIVRRGKTLKQKALERNGLASLEAIAHLVANGKNNMSAYSDRLTQQQIQDVAGYVLEQAEQGWH